MQMNFGKTTAVCLKHDVFQANIKFKFFVKYNRKPHKKPNLCMCLLM